MGEIDLAALKAELRREVLAEAAMPWEVREAIRRNPYPYPLAGTFNYMGRRADVNGPRKPLSAKELKARAEQKRASDLHRRNFLNANLETLTPKEREELAGLVRQYGKPWKKPIEIEPTEAEIRAAKRKAWGV